MSDSEISLKDTLTFVYTTACPLRCDFCCHAFDDFGRSKMNPQDVISWIQQASHLQTVKRLVFTGGEPFLFHSELLKILEETKSLHMPVRMVTSAHWACDLNTTKAALVPLRENGLCELSVSTDPSHQKFVPYQFAKNALQVALELGIQCEIASVFWDSQSQLDDFHQIPKGVGVVRRLAVPMTTTQQAMATVEKYQLDFNRFGACGDSNNYDISVYPDGTVYPCCAGGYNLRGNLGFGNLQKEPLAVIADRIHNDRYTHVVLRGGLALVYETCKMKWPAIYQELPNTDRWVSPCQLCAEIHADSKLLATLQPVLHYCQRLIATLRDMRAQDLIRRPEVLRG